MDDDCYTAEELELIGWIHGLNTGPTQVKRRKRKRRRKDGYVPEYCSTTDSTVSTAVSIHRT